MSGVFESPGLPTAIPELVSEKRLFINFHFAFTAAAVIIFLFY
jgi:hypothetical protein